MEDGEGGLSFDFEGNLDGGPAQPTASAPVVQSSADPNSAPVSMAAVANNSNTINSTPYTAAAGDRRSFRKTVCRHWLRSLCMKGDACGFLHQFDKSRMPVCRFFRLYGECREQDCVYKHTNEDIKECNMYKLGFCPNGADCRYRHAKLPGPPPPVEEVLQKIKLMTSYGHGKQFQNRNSNFSQQQIEKVQLPQGTNGVNQVGKGNPTESGNVLQQQQQSSQGTTQNVQNGQQSQASRTTAPLPQGTSRYFVVKSCNRENLELSVQQGVWATQRSNEAKLNEAFESVENVILIFSVNKTRHFQGCAKMISRIGGSVVGGNWKYAHGTAHYGRNFSVKWLKLCELSFEKTRHLRNPYNENLPVKISRDCQELEPSIGEQLASLLYLEPDSELMAISRAAELKREEEKAKGVNQDNATVNPDIVPFEDNEEEEEDDEEESEEEDENIAQGFGPFGRGRGGMGVMWPPQMPLAARGPGPFPPMRGFPPNIMGGDGFSYGPPMNPVGFPMPDRFGMNPRGFGPYNPRFPGELMFPGRPSGGFNMMMGPQRPMGPNPMRGGRPMNMPPGPPFYPAPSSSSLQQPSHAVNRSVVDRRTPPNRNDSSDQGKGQENVGGPMDEDRYQHQRVKNQQEDHYHAGNSYRNYESESEDEAPRRSRHGEGKKRRRSSEVGGTVLSGEVFEGEA